MKNLAISTMTLDKKGDAELMEFALEVLSKFRIPVYVDDGGSSEKFVRSIKLMGHKVVDVQGGLVFQHKNSILRAAQDNQYILYTEPDKFDFFVKGLEKTIETYFNGQKGFAAVSRIPEQMKTFPIHQQYWENKMNEIIVNETGFKGDFIYGPKIFTSKLAKELNSFEIKKGFGWEIPLFLVGRANKLNMSLENIYCAPECSFSQRSEDNPKYRKKQFNQNKNGFYLGLK